MVTFQEETFDAAFPPAIPLLREHWAEIARNRERIPLAPNVPAYQRAQDAGQLCIVTAKDGSELVGYTVDFVAPPLHYSETIFAESDIFWLHPAYRGRSVGVRLLLRREEALRQRRAVVIQTRAKIAHPEAIRLLTHLGHTPIETVFEKVLP